MSAKTYTPDQARVAQYLSEGAGFGGGDDPIGFLIVSSQFSSYMCRQLRDALQAIVDYHYPMGPAIDRIDHLKSIARSALDE